MEKKAMEYFQEHFNGKDPKTKTIYLRWFGRFMEYLEMTPEEFYLKAKEIKDGVLSGDIDERDENWIPDQLNKYITHLRQPNNHVRAKPYADGTITHVLKAVNAFCKKNKLTIDTSDVAKLEVKTYGKSMALADQIQRMIARSSGRMFELRNTAVVLALKDSGVRVGDLTQLTVESYQKAKANSPEPGYAIFDPLKAIKTGAFMAVHLGPEATTALDLYLGDRKTGPLFTKRESDGQGGYEVGDDGLSAGGFSMMLSRLAKEWSEISGHSLRKYHETKCGAGGMPSQLIALLNGVSTGRDSYVKNYEDGSLTRFYVKVYPELKIQSKPSKALANEVQSLEAQNQDLQQQIKQLTWEVDSIKAQQHNIAKDTLDDAAWVKDNALAILKASAKQLGLDWRTGKPIKEE